MKLGQKFVHFIQQKPLLTHHFVSEFFLPQKSNFSTNYVL